MGKLEEKVNLLEIEVKSYKNKLKFYQELEKLFNISSDITRTISSTEHHMEDFLSKSINDILNMIKKLLSFQEAKIEVVYEKFVGEKSINPFSNTLRQKNDDFEIYLKDFKGANIEEELEIGSLYKFLIPDIYIYILSTKKPYYLCFDKLKLKEDENNAVIKNLNVFIQFNKILYLKEIYIKLCEILNKPMKVLEIKELCSKIEIKDLRSFFKRISSKFKELKKHPEYKKTISKLFNEIPSLKHFGTWLKKIFLPIGKFMVLELSNCFENNSNIDITEEEKLKLAVYSAKILEIPLTAIYLNNLIHKKYLELQIANENLKKAQEEIIKLERYKRDENIAGGMAHEMGNKLFPVGINLLALTGVGIGQETIIILSEKLKDYYFCLQKAKDDNPKSIELINLLKNYETSIIPFVDKLKEADSLIRNSYNSVRMAQDVVMKLLTFAKIKATKEYREINLSNVIESILQRYSNVFMNEKINLKFEKTGEIFVSCSLDHLNILFENLIKNAIEALEDIEHKNLEINVEKENNFALVTIKDNGKGIPKEIIDKIFNPFFSTKPNKGTGLGLATVERILYEYGGKFNLNSESEKGTEFKIYLPVAENSIKRYE